MRLRAMLALLSVLVVSAARAITVAWAADAWSDSFLQTKSFDVYLLTSGTTKWESSNWGETGMWSSDSKGKNISDTKSFVSQGVNKVGTIDTDTGKMNTWANFSDVTLVKDNYYYLVFVGKEHTDQAEHYAITSGVQYVGNPKNDGIISNEIGQLPDAADFYDVSWLYTNVRGTPEPTVLALLAFGVAGLALRRRISK